MSTVWATRSQLRLSLGMPAEARSVPTVRQEAVEACKRWGLAQAATDDVALVVTELVSNAVEHAGGVFRLVLHKKPTEVVIEVEDPLNYFPSPDATPPRSHEGRGLVLVDRLVTGWGYLPLPFGKLMWASVRTTRRRRPSTPPCRGSA